MPATTDSLRARTKLVGLLALLASGLAGMGCSGPKPPVLMFSATIRVVDESGSPIANAQLKFEGRQLSTDPSGLAVWNQFTGPVMAVVSAPGFLSEPLPIGWSDAGSTVDISLFATRGGQRFAMHFAGDAMFGRRYEAPLAGPALIPLTDSTRGAQHVVRHIAPAFSVANFRSLNLETVLSTRATDTAYPGKRFLLRSHPDTTSALHALQLDMVGFANNHTRDFMDDGIADTLMALSAAGIPQAGGGLSEADASAPLIQNVSGITVSTLAYTTVTGTFVNNNYPGATEQAPESLAEKDSWLYETRASAESLLDLPPGNYRIGTLWGTYTDAESGLEQDERADVWAQMVRIFPELQDWVARRGHGGAAQFTHSQSPEQIKAVKKSSDLVVVQLHAGFQFQDLASESVRSAARAAIDAGADIVICHHPHVLQGLEWYKGHLIAYSLGNFIFDQDFLATFQSGFLRTVWDGKTMLQARFVPLELIGYQPMPVTDQTARRTLRTLWERSVTPGFSRRSAQTGHVIASRWADAPESTQSAQIVFEHHTARIATKPNVETNTITAPSGPTIALPEHQLTPSNLDLDSDNADQIHIGRDLFGWGHFEDTTADGSTDLFAHWARGHRDKQIMTSETAIGHGLLRLQRSSSNESSISIRPVARVPLRAHRLWDEQDPPSPLDPRPTYSLEFQARSHGEAEVELRIDLYDFDDSDPTKDPGSALLKHVTIPLPQLSEGFTQQRVALDPDQLTGGTKTNMLMFYLALARPSRGEATLEVDDFALIEWREVSRMPPGVYGAFTHLRNDGPSRTLSYRALSGSNP